MYVFLNLKTFCGHYTVQPALVGAPIKSWAVLLDVLEQSFAALVPLLDSNQHILLNLNVLVAVKQGHKCSKTLLQHVQQNCPALNGGAN